ncbi:TPA: hypothetical protein PXP87_004013, partial [Yersinia enterocolitica]|nr:hypothetical protein [Yersinia enterocolitica]
MGVNILILAAGQSSPESREDSYPLCLTETDGMSLIERIVLNTKKIPDSKYCFALLDKDAEKFHLDKVVKLLVKDSTVIKIPEYTKGSACTALLAASQLNQQDELLIISANELVNIDFSNVLNDFN